MVRILQFECRDHKVLIYFFTILDVSHLAIVSQSVLSYVKNISPGTRLMKIATNIYSQVTSWLASLFFSNSLAAFLPTNTESLAKALRLALTVKFENYIKDGIQGTKSCSIYVVQSNPYLPDVKFAVHLIGLPQNSIKIIPSVEGTESINVNELEKQIAADKAAEVVPLFLLADFGSSFTGGINGSISELYEVTQKNSLWLHVSGPLITAFAIAQSQADITKLISSMTLDLESWLGLPSTPTVLLYKQYPSLKQSVFDIESDMKKLEAFPLWTVIQNLGREKIVNSFGNQFQSCQILHEMVAKTRGFKIISKPPVTYEAKGTFSLDAFTSVVLFQFDGSGLANVTQVNDNGDTINVRAIEKVNHASYFDRLNSWLGQTLERDFPQIQLTLMDHAVYGTCIRYSPFELSTGEKVNFKLKF
jgi:glutamate/tyrosine decarboxylase-like PLP-dependent enzyme